MRSWRLHWDHQLYKALEHQYQLGLEALSEHLPEIKVEMIFRSANTHQPSSACKGLINLACIKEGEEFLTHKKILDLYKYYFTWM